MQPQGTICSVDLGTYTCKICAFQSKGFEILTNQANFRQTPSIVSFTPLQRLMGDQGLNKIKSNFKNTLRQPQKLIGSQNNANTVQQVLRFSFVKTIVDANSKIAFQIQTQNKQQRFAPQQILIALLTKVSEIIDSHKINVAFLAITVPIHLNYIDRSVLYQSGIAAGFNQVALIDEWMAISTDYAYFRLKDLESEPVPRFVIFIDAGHSSFSVYLCQISRKGTTLIKEESLKLTGSKNMDFLVLEFYAEKIMKSTGSELLKNPKAIIKMLEAIQKQRKILSANSQNHLTIQCLLGEQDLDYNMKRQQFENIIMPVLSEMVNPLNNMKQFIQSKNISIKSIELLGGASRIPFFQSMTSNVFKTELSRTLNASESIARGASIGVALRMGFTNQEGFILNQYNPFDIVMFTNCVRKTNKVFFRNLNSYNKSSCIHLFGKGLIELPASKELEFAEQSQFECLIFFKKLPQQTQILDQAQSYLKVQGPCKLKFQIDSNKIFTIKRIDSDGAYYLDITGIIKQEWLNFKQIQADLRRRDHDIVDIYHRKNQYEALLYQSRDNITLIYKDYVQEEQKISILNMIAQGENWVMNHNQVADLKQYTQRVQTLSSIMNSYANRKSNHEKIEQSYNQFIKTANKAITTLKNKQKVEEIEIMKQSIQFLYRQSKKSNWQLPKLTAQECNDARQQLIKTCIK